MRTLDHSEVLEFLSESNKIEGEYSKAALQDAEQAWTCGLLDRKNIDLDLILAIHRRLMKRLNPKIAGKIRDCAVSIGGKIKDQSSLEIESSLIDLCRIRPSSDKTIKKWHIAFEGLHPFEDGNGRVGRILMQLQRLNAGLSLLIITEKGKHMYYDWFK